ncbi:MAG: electron transfer flavoprotein subunit alpha/FixB family protein [Hyphomicrobiaceae bacterium]|nr:electron transfer flavoprotein subunit alpha/FixB family protein [Hyphomicrobiaceae bacterium]
MAILVLAEHDNTNLNAATAKAVTAATAMGSEVHVLVAGQSARPVAAQAARIEGVARVLLADSAHLGHAPAEDVATLLHGLMSGYDALLAPATASGKNILPRVAALLDVMQVSDITAVKSADTFERPIYAGNAIQTVKAPEAKKVVTVRTAAFSAAGDGGQATIETISAPAPSGLSAFENATLTKSDRPDLTSARIIISGGRGLQSGENFRTLIEPVADKLGAAIGASRAAVDAGFVPNDMQVGQTGKVVAPELYIAVGISGAIQHLAGMKDSKVIVAINKDEEAPIFQVADYGLVADLFQVLPELAAELDKS